jgi:hypothetical protein
MTSSSVAAVYDRRVAAAVTRMCRATVPSHSSPDNLLSGLARSHFARTGSCILIPILLTACSSAVTPDKMAQIKPDMKSDQVEAILGRPAHIKQSETTDQTLNGEVDYYPASNGVGRVIYVNHAVFKAEFVPGAKS